MSARERQLAERQYLKEYAQEWMESQTDESKRLLFSQQHPRFANLVKGSRIIIIIIMLVLCCYRLWYVQHARVSVYTRSGAIGMIVLPFYFYCRAGTSRGCFGGSEAGNHGTQTWSDLYPH